MRWLVRLVTPPDGLVLEPFAGSGATLEACRIEDVRCVAAEMDSDYVRQTGPVQGPAPCVVQRVLADRVAASGSEDRLVVGDAGRVHV
ncbi:DNA methyltransferase [Bifidobacterium longum]